MTEDLNNLGPPDQQLEPPPALVGASATSKLFRIGGVSGYMIVFVNPTIVPAISTAG